MVFLRTGVTHATLQPLPSPRPQEGQCQRQRSSPPKCHPQRKPLPATRSRGVCGVGPACYLCGLGTGDHRLSPPRGSLRHRKGWQGVAAPPSGSRPSSPGPGVQIHVLTQATTHPSCGQWPTRRGGTWAHSSALRTPLPELPGFYPNRISAGLPKTPVEQFLKPHSQHSKVWLRWSDDRSCLQGGPSRRTPAADPRSGGPFCTAPPGCHQASLRRFPRGLFPQHTSPASSSGWRRQHGPRR